MRTTPSLYLKLIYVYPSYRSISDTHFEKMCVLTNLGLWLAKHATKQAQTNSEDDSVISSIYHSLRLSAAVFEFILKDELKIYPYSPNTDFDERIIESRVIQLLAEAQEVRDIF